MDRLQWHIKAVGDIWKIIQDISCIMTLSDATLPTLPNIALKDLDLAGSKVHLNDQALTK